MDPNSPTAPPHERPRLPPELATLVSETVRRTRLRRSERRAVDAEFTAHFLDGLASGETVATLRESFGEPRVVARMVRRMVRAKRGPVDRAFGVALRGAFLGTAALALIYAGLGARVWFSSPTIAIDPAERVARLTPAVDSDAAAWPHYREALERMRDAGVWRIGGATTMTDALDPRRRDAENWATAAAALRAHRSELDDLRRAASLPNLGYRIGWSVAPEDHGVLGNATPLHPREPSVFTILLPHLTVLRRAADCLAATATAAAADGDGARAAEFLAVIPNMADQIEEAPFLVSQLVGSALVTLMADQAIALLEVFPDSFDEASLATLDAAIARVPERLRRVDMAFETVIFEDILQRVYTDDGEGGGRFLPTEWGRLNPDEFGAPRASEVVVVDTLLAPATSIMEPDRADVLAHQRAYFEALEAAGERPLWEFSFDPTPWFEHGPGGVGDSPEVFSVAAPSADKAIVRRQLSWHRLQAARAAVALQRFRLAEGRWPDALKELVPRFLPVVPPDPFDGQPLRYRLENGAPLLWSIGHDRVDDGGRLMVRRSAEERVGVDAITTPEANGAAPSMDDRNAASVWKHPDHATSASDTRDGGRTAASPGVIHFGDWIIFAPGMDWQAESDVVAGQVLHFGG